MGAGKKLYISLIIIATLLGFLSPMIRIAGAAGGNEVCESVIPDELAGAYYLKDVFDTDINQYTAKMRLFKTGDGLKGYIWSGVPDVFSLRLEEIDINNDKMIFKIAAYNPSGKLLAVRSCGASFRDGFKKIPYECRFVIGPITAMKEIQKGHMIRDTGQAVTRYSGPVNIPGGCFIEATDLKH